MIEIIPAIDLIDGKCVRLSKGDYSQKTIYNEDPLEVAKMFVDAGIRRLHLVDLDGAKAQHIVNHKVLEKIAVNTDLEIDFGGGLKSDEDLKIAFESGATMITGGSIAVKDPDRFLSWINKYGADKIILGADVKGNKVAISGWLETSSLELQPFIKNYMDQRITKVICTDISKDGMLEGPAFDLYKSLLSELKGIYLIASGGVSDIDDVYKLESIGLQGVIIGKAIYEGRIRVSDLCKFAI